MPSQQVLKEKMDEVEEISQLIKKHKVIGIASLQKVRATQLQAFKKNLAGKVYMRVMKNTLMQKAVEETSKEKPELNKLMEHLTGPNVYLLTDLNPFNLAITLEKGKVKTTAKAGDVAAFDVVVPEGNTGQPPGPMISQLNAAGLPTRIESGSVWVSKDTLVVKKGEVISERLASVLSKLGIKPVEAGLAMKVAFDEGLIITGEQLQLDVDVTRKSVESAYADAFALSLSIAYPTAETITALLQVAHREAYALSINAAVPTKETIEDLIRKAHMEMLSLSSRVPTVEEKAVPTEKTEKS
ncbi:MAG TPA: 50S ribosomal protein L10 [Candidatus Bathyarchaeia archaeon]|jgi:large subunit ribosomal protein L10|nr:50S ribosomal protein L10 [Candidatus Bathyarchaeia archaeon]